MKKTLIALAAVAVSSVAMAQVSITGGMRIGYGSNASGVAGLSSNQSSGNTINFVVSEELMPGLFAEGAAQIRYDMTNGVLNSGKTTEPTSAAGTATVADAENTRGFHTSRVGLRGAFGAIQMGRIGLDQHWGYTAFGSTSAGAAVMPVGDFGATESNQLRYITPTVAGLSAHVATSFANDGTAVNNGGAETGQQILVQYVNGPIAAMVVNETTNAGLTGTQIGVSYNAGFAKVNLVSGTSENKAGVKQKDAMLISATVPMGPITLKAAFKADNMDANAKDANAIGADYALSKRTAVELNSWETEGDTDRSMWIGVRHSF
jgi:predicted porin